jgi:hypothetical protein
MYTPTIVPSDMTITREAVATPPAVEINLK